MDNQKISFTPLQFLAIFLAMTLCGLLFLGTGMLQNVVNTASDTYEEGQATLVASRAEADEKLGEAKEELDAGEEKLSTAPAQLEEAKGKLDAAEIQLAEGQAKLDDAVPQLAAAEVKLADARVELQQGEQKLKAAAGQLAAGERNLAAGQKDYAAGTNMYNMLVKTVDELDAATDKMTEFAGASTHLLKKDDNKNLMPDEMTPMLPFFDLAVGDFNSWDDYIARGSALIANGSDMDAIRAEIVKGIAESTGTGLAATEEAEVAKRIAARKVVLGIDENDDLPPEEETPIRNEVKGIFDGIRESAKEGMAGFGSYIHTVADTGYKTALEKANGFIPKLNAMKPSLSQLPEQTQQAITKILGILNQEQDTLTQKQDKFNALYGDLSSDEFKQLIGQTILGVKAKLDQAAKDLAAGKTTLDAGYRDYADGHATLMTGRATYAAGMQEYSTKKAEFLEGQATLGEGRKEFNSKTDEYNTKLGEYEDGLATWEEGTETYNATKAEVEEQLAEGEKTLETAEVVLGGLGVKFLKDDDAVTTSNNYGIFKIIALVVYAIVGILVTVLAGAAILKKNVLALLTLKSQDVPNSTIVMRLLGFAEIAALAGAAVAIILYATALPAIVKSVGGDAMAAITIPFQMSAAVICVVVAAVSALIGVLIVGSKLPDGAIEL